jgi:hypothetical protein
MLIWRIYRVIFRTLSVGYGVSTRTTMRSIMASLFTRWRLPSQLSPAWFETGEGAPDFKPSQHIHYSKSDLDYTLDVNQVFNNLYAE